MYVLLCLYVFIWQSKLSLNLAGEIVSQPQIQAGLSLD